MSEFNLNVKHQQRYDTASNWTSQNPILLVGEIGIESDTGKLKVGNGISVWSNLIYVGITLDYLQENYLQKLNPTVNGAIQMGDSYSQITRSTVSPRNNNIGVNGVMITHYNSDEGGLLINEDGAYLWNSSDSGSLLKILDEDMWTSNAGAKKDCNFSNGLMFNFDNAGNLKLKGKVYMDNGVNAALSGAASNAITITDQNTSGALKVWTGSESSYNALSSKDGSTIYILT